MKRDGILPFRRRGGARGNRRWTGEGAEDASSRQKTGSNYIHPTPHRGRCRVRIFLPDDERDAVVVVCTEPRDNPGTSITNAAERVAGEVVAAYKLPVPLVWIEHYEDGARGTPEDPATFDMVTFASYEVEDLGPYLGEERKRIGSPSWKPLGRTTVEALVGEVLD